MYTKEWLRASLIRVAHTVAQALAATIPAGVIITADMIRAADYGKIALTVLGWLLTALLAGLVSFLKSAAIGVPEAQKPPNEGNVTVYAYEDYYEGNPVGEPVYEHEDD